MFQKYIFLMMMISLNQTLMEIQFLLMPLIFTVMMMIVT